MDTSFVNREKTLIYLREKIIEFFTNHEYIEGSYNDNRFVEYCHKIFEECWNENVFDVRDLDLQLWVGSDQQLSIKVLVYLKREKGSDPVDSDVFCKHEMEYIDWAFSDAPAACDWDLAKYRDYVEDDSRNKEINKAHRKWKDNAISNWWLENKDKNVWDIDFGEPARNTDDDEFDLEDMFIL